MKRTADLDAARSRVAMALFACDGHPAMAVLQGDACTGRTAELARRLPDELARLWTLFAALGGTPDAAASIELAADGLPAAGTGNPPVSRVAVADLAADLDRRAADLLRELTAVEAAWTAVSARLDGAQAALDRAARLADGLGGDPLVADGLRPLREAVMEVRRHDLADPVAAATARLNRLAALAASTLARLDELARFREDYPARSAALHAAVDELAAAENGTAREFAVVRAKIAGSGLPPAPRAAPVLRARLRQVDALARDGQWPTAATGCAAVAEAVTAARQRGLRLRLDAAGLLQRRDELRGRLDAYQVKAAAAGLVEDDGLAAQHERARALLHTAPCDLRESTRAVHAYQAALAMLIEERR
ncbi:hypothetical protein [Dactylosporangium sp. CA-233914]|uniref:hypothetical protein n=1 Tax=Dactylosporangium sp. CA-233914 TaxID=3239934 RepID=UPI003D946A1F